jgi:hypothetical protein
MRMCIDPIILLVLQWNLTNPNSLGPELVQENFRISETIHFEWGLFLFYLLHTKMSMNIIKRLFGLTRVRINSIRINEDLLYSNNMVEKLAIIELENENHQVSLESISRE